MKTNVGIAVVSLLVGCAMAFAQGHDLSQVPVKLTRLSGPVSMLVGAGGNIGISAGPDGILLIDDQFAPLAPKIQQAISPLSPKPLRFVLNTHWHGDHTGGNAAFGALAPIIAQRNVRTRLEQGGTIHGQKVAPAVAPALPVITYDDGISLFLNGEEIRVVHLPHGAHTDGDSVVFFTRSKVVHFGDQFVNHAFPFIDHDNGGSIRGLIANLHQLRPQLTADMKLIPGHGKLGTLEDFDAYLAMLEETTSRVEKGLKAGKTYDQLEQEKVLRGYESWANDFVTTDFYLQTLVDELGSKS